MKTHAESLRDRSPTLVLLDEWGTSGQKRPTVGDLLECLIRVPLFRAADYVATDILKEERPKRPESGPAKWVDESILIDVKQIEAQLNRMDYPRTASLQDANMSTSNNANIDGGAPISLNVNKVDLPASENHFHNSPNILPSDSNNANIGGDGHSSLNGTAVNGTQSADFANATTSRPEGSTNNDNDQTSSNGSEAGLIENGNHSVSFETISTPTDASSQFNSSHATAQSSSSGTYSAHNGSLVSESDLPLGVLSISNGNSDNIWQNGLPGMEQEESRGTQSSKSLISDESQDQQTTETSLSNGNFDVNNAQDTEQAESENIIPNLSLLKL